MRVASCERSRADLRPDLATADSRIGHSQKGFTLIELLVVILIILLVSAVALPVVLPALSHRQVSEAARILQGALVGARDAAIHNDQPSGIRLLPDPTLPAHLDHDQRTRSIPTQTLAYNRIIPIEPAPEYSRGLLYAVHPRAYGQHRLPGDQAVAYPDRPIRPSTRRHPLANVLMVKESPCYRTASVPEPADLLVLEHPGRRQDPDQQRRALVHGRRADGRSRPSTTGNIRSCS